MKAVASRVTDKSNDVLLLQAVDMDDSGSYEIPEPRQINALETYCPSYLQTPKLRRLTDIVAAQAQSRADAALAEEGAVEEDIDATNLATNGDHVERANGLGVDPMPDGMSTLIEGTVEPLT